MQPVFRLQNCIGMGLQGFPINFLAAICCVDNASPARPFESPVAYTVTGQNPNAFLGLCFPMEIHTSV